MFDLIVCIYIRCISKNTFLSMCTNLHTQTILYLASGVGKMLFDMSWVWTRRLQTVTLCYYQRRLGALTGTFQPGALLAVYAACCLLLPVVYAAGTDSGHTEKGSIKCFRQSAHQQKYVQANLLVMKKRQLVSNNLGEWNRRSRYPPAPSKLLNQSVSGTSKNF